MSWIITHQCRFQSRTGQQYCVNVSKQADTSVEVKQLIGAETPFTTSEASGDDIFTPVRAQSGTLRILDNSGGTLMDDLLPENNTQKMVALVNLTTGATEWIGFMAAEVFTQPWGNDMTELEFPLRSALTCLEDVTVQTGITGNNRLAMLVHNAFTSMFGEGQVPFTQLVTMDDFYLPYDHLLIRANFDRFYDKETIKNDNTETVIKVGQSYREAIEAMCSTFGLTLRQQGTTLIFGRYDNGNGYAVNVRTMGWSTLAYIYNNTGAYPEVQPEGSIATRDLMTLAEFRSKNNKLSFIPGGKAAIVTLNLDASNSNIIEMPQSPIADGDMASAMIPTNGEYILGQAWMGEEESMLFFFQNLPFAQDGIEKLNFQHLGRTSGVEIFNYKEVYVQLTSGVNINIVRTHINTATNYDAAAVIYRSIFGNHGRYYTYNQRLVITGAVPGRYSKENGLLENCLLLVQDVNTSSDTQASPDSCYQISTAADVEMQNCFINVKFDVPVTIFSIVQSIDRKVMLYPSDVMYRLHSQGAIEYLTNGSSLVSNLTYNMWCKLYVVSPDRQHTYYWDSSQWVADSERFFPISIKGTGIESNYHAGMDIDNTGGYLAQVTGTMTGTVIFEITNKVTISDKMKVKDPNNDYNNEVEVFAFPYQKILTGLSVDLVYSRSITSNSQGENTYRKTIMESGFSEEKSIDLELGTNNNNTPSTSLLRTYGNDGYVGTVSYMTADGQRIEERPEIHLLNRMVEQYKTMRRTMTAKIATGIDLFRNRFSYNGRLFMAIDKKHDWEREEQEVKFIEVN